MQRYLLENPWPLVVILGAVALTLGWRGLSEGNSRQQRIALSLAAAAAAIFLVATFVTTAAERGEGVVRDFLHAAEQADTSRMTSLLTPEATLHIGRPENPPFGRSVLDEAIGGLEDRYRIQANTVTQLDGTGLSASSATVLLTCFTTVASGESNVPNSWWLRVAEQKDGTWKIESIACLKVAGQVPSAPYFR